MAYMPELVSLLETSTYTPLLLDDPAYLTLQSNLESYLLMSAKAEGYTVGNLPENMEYFVILRTLKHLFRILAVSRAPEYSVESEQAKSNIGDRFAHYMSLIKDVQDEMDGLVRRGMVDAVTSYKVTTENYSPEAFKR